MHHRLVDIPVQANEAIGTLSQVFNMAQLWGLVPEGVNPCRHMPLYRRRKRERFLTAAEFARLGQVLAEAPWIGGADPRAIVAIRLLMLTGCRKRGILSLRWTDVDLKSGDCACGIRRSAPGWCRCRRPQSSFCQACPGRPATSGFFPAESPARAWRMSTVRGA